MTRIPSGQPTASSSAVPAPNLPSHLNGANGSGASKTSPHLTSRRPAGYLSSDNEEMAPPKSSSTVGAVRGRGRGRGRGGRGGRTTTTRRSREDDDAPNPLTFQCRSCFRLLGDSFAFVATDTELGYVILSDVSEIVTQDTVYETSTEPGKDIGSTFARLRCAGCNTTIGRNYRTTPRDLDDLRDCFSLEVDAVYTYQLGSNYTRQTEPPEEEGEEGEAKTQKASRQIVGDAGGGADQDAQALREKMEKTRALTIELSDRLIRAEEDIRRYSALVDQLVAKQEPPLEAQTEEKEAEADPSAAAATSEAPGTPPLDKTDEPEPKEPEPEAPEAPAQETEVVVELEAQPSQPATPAREKRASRSSRAADSAVTSGATSTRSSRRSGLSPARFL